MIGIFVGGSGSGNVTISTFAGGITNSGSISSGVNGIVVGGRPTSSGSVSILSFSGGISNAGTIDAGHGVVVGGAAFSGGTLAISNFSGGISNSSTIAAHTGSGIIVGGNAVGTNSAVTISTFSGGINNSGKITAVTSGIFVGGTAIGPGASVAISKFSGGITNSGKINALASDGIFVGGNAGSGASAVVSTFLGGILNTGTINAFNAGIHVGGSATGTGIAGVLSFAGGISNQGTINAVIAGIQVSGVSAFSGGITNSGSINAVFTGISVSNVSTFGGNISNSGTIVAGSAGIFVCNCATFAGGGIVNSGKITAGTGILVHNFAPVSIFNSGTIIGTGGTAVDLTGASGGNTFTLGPGYSIAGNVLAFPTGTDRLQLGGVGSDSFDLSGVGPSQQYENFASFNVISGTWTVSNVFGQSQSWTVMGGTLAGTGTLPGITVDAGGTLEPGTIGTPGTFMTVTGNLTFQPGAFYLVNINPTTASRVNVGGAVTLAGAVDVILAPGNGYNSKTTYNILDPTNISGRFSGVTIVNEPGLTGTLTYQPNDVLLNLTAQIGAGGGLNQNQRNAANAINTFFNNGGTVPAGLFPAFGPNGANVLSVLDGEAATGAEKGAFDLMTQFLELMLDPVPDGGLGGTGAPLGFAPERDGLPSDVTLAYAGILKAPPSPSHPSPASGGGLGWGLGQWSAWGTAFGGYNRTSGDPVGGSTTTTARAGGVTAGLDYRVSPDTILGFALAGGGTNWALAQGLGGGRSDAFEAGLYAKTRWGPVYVAGALAFANHWMSTSRFALGDQLTASFEGQSYGARLEAGRRWSTLIGGAAIGLTPYAAVQAQSFHTPSYAELDARGGALGLGFGAMTATDTRSELGARVDDATLFYGMPLILRGRAAWAHDWVSNPSLAAVFQGLPGASFTVNGAPIPHDSALASASAELRLRPNWSLTGKFESELAPGAQAYSGTATLRYAW